ncbi:MAG: M48 family metallopeptidase [Alphaproteobacteria bacterium]
MESKTVNLDVNGVSFTLEIRRNPQVRRMRVRIDRMTRRPVLVLNRRTSEKAGLEFALRNAEWIGRQLALLPEKKVFADGFRFSLLGEDVCIRHSPNARRGVWLEENIVWVSGREEHLPRRVADFVKESLRTYARRKSAEFAAALDVRIRKISIRDTKSRWGSCTKNGDVSLSGRLAFAPREVLDYVIAHEVAHLRHMDHSREFWETVAVLVPYYKLAERRLKRETAFLYSFDL